MILRTFTLALLSLLALSSAMAEQRSWTNAQGKQLQADFGGVKDGSVSLILAGGQTATVPLASLSAEDQAWVRDNASKAVTPAEASEAQRLPWDKRRMPTEVREPMLYMNIKVVKETPDECIYESGHFQFKTSARLGAILMKDVCRAFESTYELVRMLPWGVVPRPEEGHAKFHAELYETRKQYLATGAPTWSGGVYVRNEKVFRIPFEELGISNTVGANGAYYRKGEVNNDTITHEITHQMMHEYLPYMPVWLIEGLAEYTCNLNYKGGIFYVNADGGAFATRQPGSRYRGLMRSLNSPGRWIGAEELWGYTTDISTYKAITNFTLPKKEEVIPEPPAPPKKEEPPLPPGSSVPVIKVQVPTQPKQVVPPMRVFNSTLPDRYRSSHILAYFFVHDDGGRRLMRYFDALHAEKKKWPVFWAQVEAYNAEINNLRPAYDAYRTAMADFMRQPGVRELGGGRFSYPSNLTPPAPPPAPPKEPQPPDNTDPAAVCAKHLDILLDGRTLDELSKQVSALFQKSGLSF